MARESTRGKADQKSEFPTVNLMTPPVRLSYPKIFDPEKNDQGKDVWETDAFIAPDREGNAFVKDLEDALYKVMGDYFGPEDEWPTGKNDGHPSEKIKYPKDFPDQLTKDWAKITARSYGPVGIVDADCNDVLNKREAYGGRWARLSLAVTVYDNKSKGPTIYLNNVQLLDNDESFGGRPSAASEFERYSGEAGSSGGRDRGRGRDQDREDEADDRGRGRGRGARDDERGSDRARARPDRDEGRSDRDGARDRGDSRRDDEGSSRGRPRDADRGQDRGRSDRDGGGGRDRGEERDSRDGRRGSREDDGSRGRGERGGDRDRDSGRDREEDRGRGREDARSSRSRDDADDDRGRDGGRGRGRDDDDQDRRPSRGRDDRDDDRGRGRDDWN